MAIIIFRHGHRYISISLNLILDTKTKKENSQQSSQSENQNNIPYYQKYSSLSDALFLIFAGVANLDLCFVSPGF